MGKTNRKQPYKERKPVPPTGGPMADKRTHRTTGKEWLDEWEQEQWENWQALITLSEAMEDNE